MMKEEEKNAYKTCVKVWPKALVVTCSTMVLPALDGVQWQRRRDGMMGTYALVVVMSC